MTLQLPPCPQSLRQIQHYLKTASEHETRDPVVAYWCRLFALQTALKIDKKSDDAKLLLVKLMDWLETQKKVLSDNEAITNDIAAQAHIENYALKLFTWADSQDRGGVFNKNVVKAFYTAGMLMDVLSTFGELGDDIAANCKYAKWKAAYIHNCLKNGLVPVPGPVGNSEDDSNEFNDISETGPTNNETTLSSSPPSNIQLNNPSFNPVTPETFQPEQEKITDFIPKPSNTSIQNASGVLLDPTQISKAQKYCKFAGSALQYDDVPVAISYLNKALKLLQTGEDS